jgi:hypothetical protein
MLKRHIGNTIGIGLDMIIFFLNNVGGGGIMLDDDVSNIMRMLDTMLKDTKKYIRDTFRH